MALIEVRIWLHDLHVTFKRRKKTCIVYRWTYRYIYIYICSVWSLKASQIQVNWECSPRNCVMRCQTRWNFLMWDAGMFFLQRLGFPNQKHAEQKIATTSMCSIKLTPSSCINLICDHRLFNRMMGNLTWLTSLLAVYIDVHPWETWFQTYCVFILGRNWCSTGDLHLDVPWVYTPEANASWQRKDIYKPPSVGFHVSFGGCIYFEGLSAFYPCHTNVENWAGWAFHW